MKPFTDKQKQWAWFVGLWFAGLISVALLSYSIRWVIRL